jgi:hypothetical protein
MTAEQTVPMHVMDLYTHDDHLAVVFQGIPTTCRLAASRAGFATSVAQLAEAWRARRPALVTCIGTEILSVAAPAPA